ncbi:hypothetical protein KSS87_011251, partial [Heliosperma pusillum]
IHPFQFLFSSNHPQIINPIPASRPALNPNQQSFIPK